MNRGSDSRSWDALTISILCRSLQQSEALGQETRGFGETHLSHVDEPTHKILVAECADGRLGLLPCCVFHNPYIRQEKLDTIRQENSPASLHNPRTIAQSVNPTSVNQNKTRKTTITTHRRPPSTFHSEATTHQRKALLRLQARLALVDSNLIETMRGGLLTLSHKIFQVMPFHIVGEVPNVDSTFLLGRFAYGGHHLLLGLRTFLVAPWWCCSSSTAIA